MQERENFFIWGKLREREEMATRIGEFPVLFKAIKPLADYNKPTNGSNNPFLGNLQHDVVQFKPSNCHVTKNGNVLHVVSFTGQKEIPVPGIKSKVLGVMRNQKRIVPLEASNWKDGDTLNISRHNHSTLWIHHPEFGLLGKIPPFVSSKLVPLMDKGYKFRCELSDVVGGYLGAPTIGLRVNVIFDDKGTNKIHGLSITQFNTDKYSEGYQVALEKAKVGDKLVLLYDKDAVEVHHPSIGPIGVLGKKHFNSIKNPIIKGAYNANISKFVKGKDGNTYIKFDFENTLKLSPEEAKQRSKDVTKVSKAIAADEKAGEFAFLYQPIQPPEVLLDTVVDDPFTVNNIVKEINKAQKILLVGHKSPDGDAIGCVLGLGNALEHIGKNIDCCIDDDIPGLFRHNLPGIGLNGEDDYKIKKAKDLDPDKKYDLVITMDTPTPTRIGNISKYIKNKDTKTIMIDHHPLRPSEWNAVKDQTGIDVTKLQKDKLLWVNDKLPAAAQSIAALIFKLLPQELMDKMTSEDRKDIAIPMVTGMMTDSGQFARGAEYRVESMAKYFMEWAGFDKKWLRSNINYNLPKEAREEMFKDIDKYVTKEKDFSYASLEIPYEKIQKALKTAKQYDKEVIAKDVINEFKYSSLFGDLRNNNKVAVLLTQMSEKKADDPNSDDFVSISVRSADNTNYAEKICSNFGGGGHSAAAGAGLPGINLKDNVFDDNENPGKQITLERKIAQMAKDLLTSSRKKVVSFAGYLSNIKKAS